MCFSGRIAGLEPLKQLLIKRGNAFFLEETTRTLVETQALAGERGGYRLTQPLQTLPIPPTVQAVIAARIDRLSSEDKRLLQITAVIGKAMPVALLQAIAQIDEPALREGLARLQAGGFLDEVPASRGTAYVFKHALVYEVAYGGLLQERRRELHVRILDVLEAVHQDEPLDGQIERLAHHAIQGEVWEKAACLTQQAGLRAMLRSGYRQAVVCFEQALGALGHLHQGPETLAQAIDVHLQLRFALHALGELNRMGDEVEAALILAESSRDEPRIARVLSHLSQHYFLVGRLRDAVVAGERSVKVARAAGDTSTELQARFRMGLAYYDLGDFQRAVELLSSTLESLRRPSIDRGEYLSVYTRTWLAFSLAARGEFPDAVAHGQEAIRVAEMLDDGCCLGHAYLSLGVPYVLQGEWPDAIRLFEQTVKMLHDREILGLVPTSTAWLGFAYAMSGRSVEGLELLEAALATAESRGAQRLWRLMARLGSEARLRAGKPGAALEIARRGLELSRDQESHVSEAWYTWQLARITASQETTPISGHSEHGYRKALALAHDLGMRPLVAHCHLGLAELCRRAAKEKLAREHLATATSMYRDMGMRFWLQQAETHSVP